MHKTLPLIAALLATPVWAEDDGHDHDHGHDDHAHEDHAAETDDSDHTAALGAIHLLHAWTAATDDDTALIFVEIENQGDTPTTLLGASTQIAQTIDLVAFQLTDGADTYTPIKGLPIAPDSHVDLAPRGVALRMTGLTEHLHKDDTFDVSLTFDTGTVTMTGQVEAADATQHSHAGHNH